MATNIEIKASIKDFKKLKQLVEKLSDTPCEVITQKDTFFHTPNGRLKLRIRNSASDCGLLIYYDRDDCSGPKQSNYIISLTSDPALLKTILSNALGIRGVVRKQRLLYRVGNTRIHLDEVERLGSFLELEVELSSGHSPEQGKATAMTLMRKLGLEKTDLIEGAYIDLLEELDLGMKIK
jgi:predicted adenylyl cyclase CyaB